MLPTAFFGEIYPPRSDSGAEAVSNSAAVIPEKQLPYARLATVAKGVSYGNRLCISRHFLLAIECGRLQFLVHPIGKYRIEFVYGHIA